MAIRDYQSVMLPLLHGGTRRDAGEAVGGSGDEGIDGIIKEDRLGLEVVYIQAKRWKDTVQRPEIQKFVGALRGQNAVFWGLGMICVLSLAFDYFKVPETMGGSLEEIEGDLRQGATAKS